VLTTWQAPLGLERGEVRAGDGTRLSYVHGGRGRRVIFLHGAPQFSYAWRKVLPELARDYRVIAPDLRGYGASELAANGRYDLDTLARDLAALVDATGPADEQVILALHDWGGPIGFHFAAAHPSRVRHVVAANAPHPTAYARDLLTAGQALRSWYIAAFQTPGLERLIELSEGRVLFDMMGLHADGIGNERRDIDVYRWCFARPCRPAAVLAYYRDAFGKHPIDKARAALASPLNIETPTTILWGARDRLIAPSHPDACRPFFSSLVVRRLDASHWVPEEGPDAIVRAVREGDQST
jgi:pimeloyl-ACP methyl ester carboxylesterase